MLALFALILSGLALLSSIAYWILYFHRKNAVKRFFKKNKIELKSFTPCNISSVKSMSLFEEVVKTVRQYPLDKDNAQETLERKD